jgi:hypothetical protein
MWMMSVHACQYKSHSSFFMRLNREGYTVCTIVHMYCTIEAYSVHVLTGKKLFYARVTINKKPFAYEPRRFRIMKMLQRTESKGNILKRVQAIFSVVLFGSALPLPPLA